MSRCASKCSRATGPCLFGGGAQQRQRDGVVAAEGHQAGAVGGQLERGGLDGLDGLVDVERVDGDVAGVGDLGDLERRHVQRRVVGPQQPRRLADVRGPEAGAGPVGDAGVERHADDDDVGGRHLVESRQPGERCGAGEARRLRCVDRRGRSGAVVMVDPCAVGDVAVEVVTVWPEPTVSRRRQRASVAMSVPRSEVTI